jgi:putative phosphoesterase
MLLGILSDSHGNVEAIQEVSYRFLAAKVNQVLHLGDDYLDILFFEAAHFKVLAVPGLYCPEYRDPTIPNRRIEDLGGVKILMTHSHEMSKFDQPGDLDPEGTAQVDIVLYGHTHIPKIQEKQGVLWVNPGHLKAHDRRGYPLSYALMHLTPPTVDVRILTLATGQTLLNTVFTLRH